MTPTNIEKIRAEWEKIIWRHYDPDHALNVEELLDEAMPIITAKLLEREGKMREVCVCAAVKTSDGYIIRGHRHHNCIATMRSIPRYKEEKYGGADSHGFVTSLNRFVTRQEGLEIQKAAGIESVAEGGGYRNELFSEDLY